jgi:hypothetical protein
MTFLYPQSDLDSPAALTALLGSFWSGTYEGSSEIEAYAGSRAILEQQTLQNFREAADATSRQKIPVYHTDLWYQLVLRESEMNSKDFSIPKYGEHFVYGAQPDTDITLLYGEPTDKGIFAFEAPHGLISIPAIFSRTDRPSVSWLSGLEYTIDDGYIKFINNPFETTGVALREVVEKGVVVDREVSLWAFRSQWDLEYIWTHFGYVTGVKLGSSPGYKKLVNGLMDAAIDGGSLRSITEIISAVAGAPTVIEDEETVEYVATDSRSVLVITDKNCYRHGKAAVPTVSVGDRVAKGEFLCLAARMHFPGREPKPDWLAALSLDESYTSRFYRGGLLFIDQDLDVTVSSESGKTRIDFEVMGYRPTITKFWNDVHALGVSSGSTLANLLDKRPDPNTEPTSESLPSTINPLEFLLDNVLRNNATIVLLRPTEFGEDKLPLSALGAIRRTLPPQQTAIILVQLEAVEDSAIQDGSSSISSLQWLGELDEEGTIQPGQVELSFAGYTDAVCW